MALLYPSLPTFLVVGESSHSRTLYHHYAGQMKALSVGGDLYRKVAPFLCTGTNSLAPTNCPSKGTL